MARKHFIAGARCPHCNAEDRVRLCRDMSADGREVLREWIECVACGHASENPGEPEHPNPPPDAPADEPVSVVRFPGRK